MKICVCDIGGTNFRMAVYEDGRLCGIRKRKTPNFYSCTDEFELKKRITEAIKEGFCELCEEYGVLSHLAVCFPGPVDVEGNALASSVIFGNEPKEPFRLREQLEAALAGTKVIVTNDITAAAHRYMELYENFCLITVSSGIGNKICIGGRVIIDSRGRTGEIGHFATDIPGFDVECTCGAGKNHVGMISSGRGVQYFAQNLCKREEFAAIFAESELYAQFGAESEKITAEAVAVAADRGDKYARSVIDVCTYPLASEISLLAIAMDIPKFVIIGGFALNCDYYVESLKRNVIKKGVYNFGADEIAQMIVTGEKDDDHGLIGAGKMMLDEVCREKTLCAE